MMPYYTGYKTNQKKKKTPKQTNKASKVSSCLGMSVFVFPPWEDEMEELLKKLVLMMGDGKAK